MSSARDNIMQRIRQANRERSELLAVDELQQRIQQHNCGPLPQWPEDLVTRFIQKAEQSAASLAQINTEKAIVDEVLAYLDELSLGGELLCGSSTLIQGLDWPDKLSVATGSATTEDKVVLVEAFAGIAETGSVVICSGKESPVSLNFLADHYLCVVHRDSVVRNIEDVWARLRERGIGMPRAVNIITGPSRTADVEQIIQMGAHGPRKVHLLLLN